jgi:hypothetical protein
LVFGSRRGWRKRIRHGFTATANSPEAGFAVGFALVGKRWCRYPARQCHSKPRSPTSSPACAKDGFPNEQAISQGIVLRVLQELGWDTWDTAVVWPEYQTGQGRADLALCHPPSKPAIFIEVKQPGKAEDAVRQALEYAFHTGVPFIVLTDGRTWSFYLPAEQGSYEAESARRYDDVFEANRRASKLDMLRRYPANECVVHWLTRATLSASQMTWLFTRSLPTAIIAA